MNIMTKRGQLDNIVTFEHICDTQADMSNIPSQQITLGSVCIVLKNQNNQFEVYMADSNKQWYPIASNIASSPAGAATPFVVCGEDDYDLETGLPTIEKPEPNTVYLVPGTGNGVLFSEYIYTNNEWQEFNTISLNVDEYLNMASAADVFSDEDSYLADDLVVYKGLLYQFIDDHTGAWNLNDVQAITIESLLDAINESIEATSAILNTSDFIRSIVPATAGYINTGDSRTVLDKIDSNEPFSPENMVVTASPNDNAVYTIIPCQEGDSFYTKGKNRRVNGYWYFFIDDEGNILQKIPPHSKTYQTHTAPEDAAYVIFQNTRTSEGLNEYYKIVDFRETLEEINNKINTTNGNIAYIENTTKADIAHEIGDLFILNNQLFKATKKINPLATLTEGNNMEKTTIAVELQNILARLEALKG